jgi:hypothetical protein
MSSRVGELLQDEIAMREEARGTAGTATNWRVKNRILLGEGIVCGSDRREEEQRHPPSSTRRRVSAFWTEGRGWTRHSSVYNDEEERRGREQKRERERKSKKKRKRGIRFSNSLQSTPRVLHTSL